MVNDFTISSRSGLLIGCSVIGCLLLGLWFAFSWGGQNTLRVVDGFAFAAFGTYAGACGVLAARAARGQKRRAWATMAMAMAAWTAGELLRALDTFVRHRTGFPSPCDFFYFVFVVLICVAFVQFPADPRGPTGFRVALDALLSALALFLLLWVIVLGNVRQVQSVDSAAQGRALLYPMLVLVVFVAALVYAVRSGGGDTAVMWLFLAAVTLMVYSGAAFAVLQGANRYYPGHVTSVGWAISMSCFGAAALLSRRSRPLEAANDRTPGRVTLWLPYVPLLIAGTVGPAIILTGILQVGVPVLMAVICVRQVIAGMENKALLTAAANQALRDPLTGLANRTLFQDRLAQAIARRRRDHSPLAVVSLDLDDFKLINDSLGHPTADGLLVGAGQRIAACVRDSDTVARVGGDEFALLIDGGAEEAQLVCERVVAAFDTPFIVDGHEVLIRTSAGMAAPAVTETEVSPEELVRRADIAMYLAKRSRDSVVHTFSSDLTPLDPAIDELTNSGERHSVGRGAAQVRLLGELRRAIDREDLELVYQPKLELATGRLVGVEALLRWDHPRRGVLRPAVFLPLVVRHGLARAVTDLVFRKALDDAARWVSMGREIPVAINLFAPLLRDLRFPATIGALLHERELPARLVTIEITEDLVLDELGRVTAGLHRLRDAGIRIAIDDFGSGYSALSYLRDLPIDEVKLDRHFIASVAHESRAAAVVSAVIELNHNLGIEVVAEGVEDAETAGWLREHACDIGQGYYFGRPVSGTQVSAWVAEHALSTSPDPLLQQWAQHH